MPKFSELAINGSPATSGQPGKGTHLEDKAAWALEVALDVETSHAIAPQANILLVHSNNAETLGVQGFPNMMKAEDYVVPNHLAQVISQSFASSEDAFSSYQSLLNLRYAFKNAAASGVTVLGSSGDDGSTNFTKQPVAQGGRLIPFPAVEWPASDPLVTGVGGTYLCTDPLATASQARTADPIAGLGAKCGSSTFNAAGARRRTQRTSSTSRTRLSRASRTTARRIPAFLAIRPRRDGIRSPVSVRRTRRL